MGDSQLLRWIDELNGNTNKETQVIEIKNEIKRLRNEPDSLKNRRAIRRFYESLDNLLFVPDYLCIIADKVGEYRRACKGFKINGIEYVRLLATNGGVKNKTIVFVNKELAPELNKRIENNRCSDIKHVPAKLEAYKALVCSSSTPVSFPKGILVIPDCITHFTADIIHLNDASTDEPAIKHLNEEPVELIDSDGYGLISPGLAKKWSEELGLDYQSCGFNTRFAWEKGMVFCFDFHEFAETIAKNNIVTDAWGNKIDIRNIELILTTSMVKLWDSYKNINEYIQNSLQNQYTFNIAKICPEYLESERVLNYQFIQSYMLDNQSIQELIQPTIDEIKDILSGDFRKTLLYVKGIFLKEQDFLKLAPDFSTALMIDKNMIHDPYVQSRIHSLIKKRITNAKIGAIKVHGNYSVVSGDPFALCQHIFDMEVTGLLKAGEIYNQYWANLDSTKVVCFRAPMTCHNNIRILSIKKSIDINKWYKYLTACTILNSWDTVCHALNGMDKDGDQVLLTDNSVLLSHTKELPAIFCEQRKAEKVIINETKLIQSNIDSFGDAIGKTTNHITSMFELLAKFSPDSEEYNILQYRIKCGQLFQQNAIDKTKGIIAKAMPRSWYDPIYLRKDKNSFPDTYFNVLADKKPYFMIYIYPALMKKYKLFTKNTEKKSLREFRISIQELLNKDYDHLTNQEKEFIYYYNRKMPVGTNDCIMNKICKTFENEFDGILKKLKSTSSFDYTILKKGIEYSKSKYNKIFKLYQKYQEKISNYMKYTKHFRLNKEESKMQRELFVSQFKTECLNVCSSRFELCDILLDICYTNHKSKQFVWDICGNELIENLLLQNNNIIQFPVMNENGDISYAGKGFSMKTLRLEC